MPDSDDSFGLIVASFDQPTYGQVSMIDDEKFNILLQAVFSVWILFSILLKILQVSSPKPCIYCGA